MPGFIGLPEIMLLALLALVLFGPKRLPEMGRSLGKGLREFKESVGGEHAGLHGIDIDKLAVPVTVETTTTETAPLDKAA
jgi:sec-independent protein translocase protein TatA